MIHKISQNTDFSIIEKMKGTDKNVPFRFTYYTQKDGNKYTASFDGYRYFNCDRYDDEIIIVNFNNPKFEVGRLYCSYEFDLDDNHFEDNQNNIKFINSIDIFIVDIVVPKCDGVEHTLLPAYQIIYAEGSGAGLTVTQKQWIKDNHILINKANSLPEGIDLNTSEILALKDNYYKRFPFNISYFKGDSINIKGDKTLIFLEWEYDGIPTNQLLKKNGTDILINLDDRSYSEDNITEDTVFELISDSLSKEVSILFVNPKYFGVVSSIPTNEEEIKNLTELPLSISRDLESKINLSNQLVCYAYPKELGELESIKDQNNFECIDVFNQTLLSVNNEEYLVYTLNSRCFIDNFKITFH